STGAQLVNFITGTLGVSAVASVEGLNEPNNGEPAGWVDKTVTNQQDVYTAMKGNASTKNIPVFSPSLTNINDAATMGKQEESFTQFINLHTYPGARNPETGGWGANGYGSMAWALTYMATPQGYPSQPAVVTETGAHDASQTTSGFQYSPDPVIAVYTP